MKYFIPTALGTVILSATLRPTLQQNPSRPARWISGPLPPQLPAWNSSK